ncbi:TIGR04255 family protein [Chitinimonas arctica]|nr:TIGR04255 family protein [Chitinimonas arctica]
MKIEPSQRVLYAHNPLAEVVCQARFEKLPDLSEEEVEELKAAFTAAGYPTCTEEISFGYIRQLTPHEAAAKAPVPLPETHIYRFNSLDGVWRISLCSEFVALTCYKYSGWSDYLPRILNACQIFFERHPAALPLRLGLRYKDVIERGPIGLEDVPWHELIQPFLLGPLSPNALAVGQIASDEEVENFLSQSLLKLDGAMLLLQSSVLVSVNGQDRAFLIDADFYKEENLDVDAFKKISALESLLESLHSYAGALFRRAITERLHNALRPSTI